MLNLRSILLNVYSDVCEMSQLSFQDAGSPIMEEIIFFHDEVMFILTVIITLVLWLIMKALINRYFYKYLVEGTVIEIV